MHIYTRNRCLSLSVWPTWEVWRFETGLKNQNNISPGAPYLQHREYLGTYHGRVGSGFASDRRKLVSQDHWSEKQLLLLSMFEERFAGRLKRGAHAFFSTYATTFLRARACKKAAIKYYNFNLTKTHIVPWNRAITFSVLLSSCHRISKWNSNLIGVLTWPIGNAN